MGSLQCVPALVKTLRIFKGIRMRMVRAMRCRDFWICVKSRVPHSATEMLLMTTSQIPLGTFNRSHPDCGPVCIWHGQSSVCASPSHVPKLWACLYLAWAVFSVCQPYSCTQTVVPSDCVLSVLVMYPDCGLLWHGQSSLCASPS